MPNARKNITFTSKLKIYSYIFVNVRMADRKGEEYVDDPIVLFSLKELPKELNNIDRRVLKVPPVLQRQLACLSFQVGRINVTGDGNCGYYVIQLLHYLINHTVGNLYYLRMKRTTAILSTFQMKLLGERDHYLEYLEVGTILQYLAPNLNVAVVVQTNVKKTGDKRQRREYPVRVLNYKPGGHWAFLLMSHNAHHYELLSIRENDKHRALFLPGEARELFDACFAEYPKNEVHSSEQLVFLDANDFLYF